MVSVKEQKNMSRPSDHRVWLLLASLTIAVLVWACSSDTTPTGTPDAMTQG